MTVEIPAWIDSDYADSFNDASYLRDLQYGGCASGVYMPAVTYHTARETMAEYGDEVLQYLEDRYGELPTVPKGSSWSGIAVFYLSAAVEVFASEAADMLEDETLEEEADRLTDCDF